MKRLPTIITILLTLAMLWHGPIAQPVHYHDFANQQSWLGIPHASDVLSNMGFLLIGAWGFWRLKQNKTHPALCAGWPGYKMMLLGLVLVGAGSSWYHLAPDDARLIWDRLPIALTCAGMLAATRAESRPGQINVYTNLIGFSLFGVASVAWWVWTQSQGQGDLRPYLLMQILPLIVIPLWQGAYGAPKADRLAFGATVLLYVLAKVAEIQDVPIFNSLGIISGHTLKHMLASAGMAVMVCRLVVRSTDTGPQGRHAPAHA